MASRKRLLSLQLAKEHAATPPSPLSPAATRVQLPYELLSDVFNNLLAPFDFDDTATARSTRRTLSAAALVCSHWRDPAQRALFEHPLFTDLPHNPPLTWFQGEARKRYIVRAMDFATARYGVGTEVLRDVLEASAEQGLEEVRIGYITSGSPWTLLTLPVVGQLKRLTLAKLDWWMFPADAIIPQLHLTSLNLTLRRDTPNVLLVCALISATSQTLTTLELDLVDEPGQPGAGNDLSACLDAFLPLIGATLLRLVLIVHYKLHGLERVLAHFSALTRLRLEFRNELDHVEDLEAVVEAIPRSVSHLTLGFGRRRSPEPELGVVLARLGPSIPARAPIRSVSLVGVVQAKLVGEGWDAFLGACAAKAVEVVVRPRGRVTTDECAPWSSGRQ